MEFQLTATQLSLTLAVFIPAIVALLTKATAAPWVKQVANLAVAAVAGWFAAAASTTTYDLKSVLLSIGTTFLFSVAAYFGLKQIVVLPIENKTGTVGIG